MSKESDSKPHHHAELPKKSDLSDFGRIDRRWIFICLLSIAVGLAGAIIAVALLNLINLFTNLFYFGSFSLHPSPSISEHNLGIFAVLVPVVGGLIIGFMARYGSERIRGHGIPEALEAILIGRSKMHPKVTILKPLSSAISIGSGGPFGAEGPIIMTGGSFASVFAQFMKLSSMERKVLLVAGAAAGMTAVFNTPISAVLLSVELLLFEWRPRSLIPVGIAAFTSAMLRGLLIGTAPLFPIPATPVPDIPISLSAILIGGSAGLVSIALTKAVYVSEDIFHRLPIHWMWWPAIGGLIVGIGGLFAPQALGVGYDIIRLLLSNQIAISLIIVLVIVKAVIWALSLGSGTSGGVLAPLLIIGGCMGMLLGHLLPFGTPPLWVLVSMGAIIGGTMRAPLTGVIFSFELTQDINALLPLLIGALTAEAITISFLKRSILTEKIARRGVHISREYSVDILELVRVREVMHNEPPNTVTADSPMSKLIALYYATATKSPNRVFGYPVVDAIGSLQGFITPRHIESFIQKNLNGDTRVLEVLPSSYSIVFPDDPLKVAADRMIETDLDSLPVVDPKDPQKVLGIISQEDFFRARILWAKEEKNRERELTLSTIALKGITTANRIRNLSRSVLPPQSNGKNGKAK